MMKTGILLLLTLLALGAVSQDLNKEFRLELPEFGKIQEDQKIKDIPNPYFQKPYQDHFNKHFKKPGRYYPGIPKRSITRDAYSNMPIFRPRNTDLGKMPVMIPDSTVNYAIKEYRFDRRPELKNFPNKRK